MTKNNVETQIQDNKVIYKRFYDSPVELVFDAWSKEEHLSQWWGPDGFTITTQILNFTNGGFWAFTMHGPDGTNYKNKMQFVEIKKPSLIEYKHLGDGESKNTEDVHFKGRITFEKTPGGTTLTMTQEFPSKAELERVEKTYGAIEGGRQHLGNLAKYLDKVK